MFSSSCLPGAAFRWKPGLRALFLAASFEMECRLWGLVRIGGDRRGFRFTFRGRRASIRANVSSCVRRIR